MKRISLTRIKLTNFRSFVGSTTIDLTTGAGLKLVTGYNIVEPRLGANGVGKSTLWDAVCFALYGTSVKGLRASDLIAYGALTMSVELTLMIDGQPVTIQRSSPPNRTFIGDRQCDQQAIDELVVLSKPRFLNSVIFGQAVPLFIDLPVPARGDMLDDVLTLDVWMRAADLAGEMFRGAQTSVGTIREAIQHTLGQLDGLALGEDLRAQEAAWEAEKTAQFEAMVTQLEEAEQEHTALLAVSQQPVVLLDERRLNQDYVMARNRHNEAIQRKTSLETQLRVIEENLRFLDDNENCPTCEQPMSEMLVEAFAERVMPQVEALDRDIANATLDIDTTEATMRAADETWRRAILINEQRRSERTVLNNRIATLAADIARIDSEAVRLSEDENPYSAQAAATAQEQQRLEGVLELQQIDEQHVVASQQRFDFWRQGFRRVRLYCLERVLEELSLETRNSLLALGLPDWSIVFKTATETRSGTVKLGVQIDVWSPTSQSKYDMMSGGESQRARLAVSLGLANLIQRWAGVRFDFEVFDEPTAWLSEQGVEDLLEGLRARAEAGNRSIWICDHRALAHSGFVEQLYIVKDENGSRLEGEAYVPDRQALRA